MSTKNTALSPKKKVLFIDRDGTIIVEPPVTYQVDTLEQLEFLPGVIRNLFFIRTKLDFEWALVTNQDGLGTPGYPQENFDRVHSKFTQVLKNEGIEFDKTFIDTSFPEDNRPTRKPGIAMEVKIEASWKKILQPEFDKPYFKQLTDFVRDEYRSRQVFPPASLIFNAFNLCPFDKTKVVIIGQDPYHETFGFRRWNQSRWTELRFLLCRYQRKRKYSRSKKRNKSSYRILHLRK